MQTKLMEAVTKGEGWKNFGKFMVARFDEEWEHISEVVKADSGRIISLLAETGKSPEMVMVFDLQTGEGLVVRPGGCASADLNKHKVWVCPLFEPFLNWLYEQDLTDLEALPNLVELDAEFSMSGYRRKGRKT